jgi:hypothetical protein
MHSARAILRPFVLLLVLGIERASAQSTPPARPDSVEAQQPADARPQRGWVSAGVGVGIVPYGSLSGLLAGWYTVGPVAMGARLGGAAQIFGEQRGDGALLVGGRTRDDHVFLLGAVGIGEVSSSRTCDGPCTELKRPLRAAAAYALEAHANYSVAGLGLAVFGAFGPQGSSYNALALTLNVGWFGP